MVLEPIIEMFIANLSTVLMTTVSIVSLVSVLIGIWNTFVSKDIALIVTELQLNMKKEFNGRYQTLTSAGELKERVTRLEEHEDHKE